MHFHPQNRARPAGRGEEGGPGAPQRGGHLPGNQEMVEEFHATFGIPVSPRPGWPGDDRAQLRNQLIREEANELAGAIGERNLVEVADALGRYAIRGLRGGPGVRYRSGRLRPGDHRSNMTKLWDCNLARRFVSVNEGARMKVVTDGLAVVFWAGGKIIKPPPSYSTPDLKGVLHG